VKLLARTGAIVATLALLLFAAAPAASQEGVRVSVVAPEEEPEKGDTFDVQIMAENVTNLGGFQFSLQFDNEVLTATNVARTDFLGSTGRDVVCDDPQIAGPTVRLICVTGAPEPPGVDGSGVLATVTFEAIGTGDSPLDLTAQLSRIDGVSLPATVDESAEISIGEPMDWTPIILIAVVVAVVVLVVAAAAAFLLRRRRNAAPADWAQPWEPPPSARGPDA
jgi:hypothetical protein